MLIYRGLNHKEQAKIELSISKYCIIEPTLELDDLFEFKKEKLSYDNHTDIAIAELSTYFDGVLDKSFRVFAYNFIAGEVLRKNNYEGALRSDEELIKLKSISRNEFEGWLSYCSDNIKTTNNNISELKEELRNVKIPFLERKSYISQAERYQLLTKTNNQIITKFKVIITENSTMADGENILECAEKILAEIESKIIFIDHYSRKFKLSAIMLELC